MCPPIELNLVKKALKRSVKVAHTSESVKKSRVEDDVIDIDTLSKNNNVYVDQEGVRDGAPWLKCEHRLLKTTDRDMILKSSVYFAIAVSQIAM